MVEKTYLTYKEAIFELERSGQINMMTATDIRDYVRNSTTVYKSKGTFSVAAGDYLNTVRADKTKAAYKYTFGKLGEFSGKKELAFEDVTLKFLREFQAWLLGNGAGVNTVSIHLRNIRAVFNRAIDDEVTTLYPFRKFKILSVKREIRAISVEKMRLVYGLELAGDEGLRIARDCFMLSFFLCGINPVDIFNLANGEGVKTQFIRTKIAHKFPDPVRIAVQPEAAAIVKRYKGKGHLLCFADSYVDYETFYHRLQIRMRRLSELLGFKITMYTARYTWATIADSLDISEKTISKALGHADTSLTGKKYIAFDWSKVDEANRKVIDRVVSG
jgi:integrase